MFQRIYRNCSIIIIIGGGDEHITFAKQHQQQQQSMLLATLRVQLAGSHNRTKHIHTGIQGKRGTQFSQQ